MMSFEFDLNKSISNKQKHGIDFYETQKLWHDQDLIEIPVKSYDEPRFLVIGMINGRHWSSIITYRENSIRIISARRSREKEIEIYES